MRLLTTGRTCDGAADDAHPNAAVATATGIAPAKGWPPCCGSETVLCGSMSETLSWARGDAQLPGPGAPASKADGSSAAGKQTTAATPAAVHPAGTPPEAATSEACSLPPCLDGHLHAACRRQLTKDRTVTICWRCPQ